MTGVRASIDYTARRSLAPGHTANTSYSIELDIADATYSVDDVKDVERSQGGGTETIFHRQDITWRITFAPVRGFELALLREFLDSTESGHAFQITLYGDEAIPLVMKRIEDSLVEQSFMRVGGADADWFQITVSALQTGGPAPGGLVSPSVGPGGAYGGDGSDSIDIYADEVSGPFGGLDPPLPSFTITAGSLSAVRGYSYSGIGSISGNPLVGIGPQNLTVLELYSDGVPASSLRLTVQGASTLPAQDVFGSILFTDGLGVRRRYYTGNVYLSFDFGSNSRQWIWLISPNAVLFNSGESYVVSVA